MPSPSSLGTCQNLRMLSPSTWEIRRSHDASSRSLPECNASMLMSKQAYLLPLAQAYPAVSNTHRREQPLFGKMTSLIRIRDGGVMASLRCSRMRTQPSSGLTRLSISLTSSRRFYLDALTHQSCMILCM